MSTFLPLPYIVLCKPKNKNREDLGWGYLLTIRNSIKQNCFRHFQFNLWAFSYTCTQRWQVWVNFWTVKIICLRHFLTDRWTKKPKNKRLCNPAVGTVTNHSRSIEGLIHLCSSCTPSTLQNILHSPIYLIFFPFSPPASHPSSLPPPLPYPPSPFSPLSLSFPLCIPFLPSGIRQLLQWSWQAYQPSACYILLN